MPILDHRDKIVRTLTLRQQWPRNMTVNRQVPKWQRLPTHAPFPSNVLYDRPRTVDRTAPTVLMATSAAPTVHRTHAEANEAAVGKVTPSNWNTMKLSDKQAWLDDN